MKILERMAKTMAIRQNKFLGRHSVDFPGFEAIGVLFWNPHSNYNKGRTEDLRDWLNVPCNVVCFKEIIVNNKYYHQADCDASIKLDDIAKFDFRFDRSNSNADVHVTINVKKKGAKKTQCNIYFGYLHITGVEGTIKIKDFDNSEGQMFHVCGSFDFSTKGKVKIYPPKELGDSAQSNVIEIDFNHGAEEADEIEVYDVGLTHANEEPSRFAIAQFGAMWNRDDES